MSEPKADYAPARAMWAEYNRLGGELLRLDTERNTLKARILSARFGAPDSWWRFWIMFTAITMLCLCGKIVGQAYFNRIMGEIFDDDKGSDQ